MFILIELLGMGGIIGVLALAIHGGLKNRNEFHDGDFHGFRLIPLSEEAMKSKVRRKGFLAGVARTAKSNGHMFAEPSEVSYDEKKLEELDEEARQVYWDAYNAAVREMGVSLDQFR